MRPLLLALAIAAAAAGQPATRLRPVRFAS